MAGCWWVALCVASVRDWQKPLPQSRHLNGFSTKYKTNIQINSFKKINLPFEWVYLKWTRKLSIEENE